jgi:hypothetical protein
MMTALLALILSGGDALTADEFRAIHDKLKPPVDEAWRKIPWKTNLVEAQNAAVKEKKAIFIWSMDGNPLGCG